MSIRCCFNAFLGILFSTTLLISCGGGVGNSNSIHIKPYEVKGLDTLQTNSGLQYIMVKQNPTGKLPSMGKQVVVNYTGFFEDGKVFDSSVKRGQALPFTLGIGMVISGWDEGISLLHVGEKARFVIPPQLGYGIEGSGEIPPMSTLIFDVELIAAD